jgi:hypothetical protein
MKYKPPAVALIVLFTLVGCQSSGIEQTAPNAYKVSQKSAGGIFTDTAALRDEVIQQANAFAAGKGKIAVEIASHSSHPIVGGLPSFEYEFRLEDPPSQTKPEATQDVADQIVKLDELRKKGLITDAQFEAAKQKLLDQIK